MADSETIAKLDAIGGIVQRLELVGKFSLKDYRDLAMALVDHQLLYVTELKDVMIEIINMVNLVEEENDDDES